MDILVHSQAFPSAHRKLTARPLFKFARWVNFRSRRCDPDACPPDLRPRSVPRLSSASLVHVVSGLCGVVHACL